MINNDIQVLAQDRRTIIQTYYKLRYNSRNYTFLDYVYEESGEPVSAGEMCVIMDHFGKTVESEDLKETFGVFVNFLNHK
jgi:hypothetical protein